ncbi:MAG: hypothetical protein ACRCYZ_06485 [Alphaproteobacteria bacterium]
MMKRFTKDQSALFDKLFDVSYNWGEGSNCTGLFSDFGGNNKYLATCFEDGTLEILEFNGSYFSLYGRSRCADKASARKAVMKVVKHLMVADFDTLGDL